MVDPKGWGRVPGRFSRFSICRPPKTLKIYSKGDGLELLDVDPNMFVFWKDTDPEMFSEWSITTTFPSLDYLVDYAKSIKEENRKLKKQLRKSRINELPPPTWTEQKYAPRLSFSNISPVDMSKSPDDFQVVLSRRTSDAGPTQHKPTTSDRKFNYSKTDLNATGSMDIEKIIQMEVDAAVGQLHVSMQRDIAKLRARYRTKLHRERMRQHDK